MTLHITPQELFLKLKDDAVILIDVREKNEFDRGYIPKALLFPLSTFSPKDFMLIEKPIVFYCKSGARSAHACEEVHNIDPKKEVYNLQGGILAWIEAGFLIHD
jgi:rhodanese-related sulfurtransferase